MTPSYYGTAEIKKAGALSNVMGKQEKLHIWNLDNRQQVLAGRRCVVVGFVLMEQPLPAIRLPLSGASFCQASDAPQRL